MNSTDRYRLEALLEMGGVYPAPQTVSEIARRRGIPTAFLRRILAEMVRGGVVASSRGPAGGVRLATRPRDIRLAAILPGRPTAPASEAVSWLEERLEATRHDCLASLSLASLVEVERRLRAEADWQI